MNTFDVFLEAFRKHGVDGVADRLLVHKGTINRWVSLMKVPENYYNDLNSFLGHKYPKKEAYRDKDQFYTKKQTASYCTQLAFKVLRHYQFKLENYTFIEPSAGAGNFYYLLPRQRRIGLDLSELNNKELLKTDYLNYVPPKKAGYIVIGNPPFGLRGNLALRFINHSYRFADAVCFILPQLFESDGKGVPKKRVVGYRLGYSEKLPLNSFEYPNGREVSVATTFQIWLKKNTHLIKEADKQTCDSFIKVYSLSDGGTPSSTRNKHMIGKCDVYLPSTTFQKVRCVTNYEALPHRRGYGVVFLRAAIKLKKLFMSLNWEEKAFLSTNSALNLRTSLIKEEVIKAGFCDNSIF